MRYRDSHMGRSRRVGPRHERRAGEIRDRKRLPAGGADGAAAGQRSDASTTGGSPAAPRMNIPCEPWPM